MHKTLYIPAFFPNRLTCGTFLLPLKKVWIAVLDATAGWFCVCASISFHVSMPFPKQVYPWGDITPFEKRKAWWLMAALDVLAWWFCGLASISFHLSSSIPLFARCAGRRHVSPSISSDRCLAGWFWQLLSPHPSLASVLYLCRILQLYMGSPCECLPVPGPSDCAAPPVC